MHTCQEEYIRRIHQVEDYIEKNAGKNMTLEELSDVAGFSKFHFSRIFQGLKQEPLVHFVNRIRLEQSVFFLAHRPDKNITDIALELGFSDSAVFSRAFKNYYDMSPREFRMEYSKNCKDEFLLSEYNGYTAKERKETSFEALGGSVTIEEIPKRKVLYVRHTGTYQSLAEQYGYLLHVLLDYAVKHGLWQKEKSDVLAIYHDNPEFSESEQFRTSICITVPENTPIQEDGIINTMLLEGGMYAIGHFRIRQEQYPDAWNYMYREWLSCSGYVPRNSYPFEQYGNNPDEDALHMSDVDIYVPIEPLTFSLE